MNIQVIGSGCATCKKLYELTKQAVEQLELNHKVEYVTDISKIVEMGIMTTPVLAIDGKAVLTGYVPDIEKIKELLIQKPQKAEANESSCSCGGKC